MYVTLNLSKLKSNNFASIHNPLKSSFPTNLIPHELVSCSLFSYPYQALCSSFLIYTVLHVISQIFLTCFCLRTFALTMPTTWNLLLYLLIVCFFKCLPKSYLLIGDFSEHQFKTANTISPILVLVFPFGFSILFAII